jgi:hypothetical protein
MSADLDGVQRRAADGSIDRNYELRNASFISLVCLNDHPVLLAVRLASDATSATIHYSDWLLPD